MSSEPTRRGVLAGLAGTAGALALGTGTAVAGEGDCDGLDDLKDEVEAKRAELEEMEETIESGTGEIKAQKLRIMELMAAAQDHQFDAATRQSVLDLGKEVRKSVMMLDVTYPHGAAHGTGWFHEDGTIITNAHNVNQAFEESYGYSVDKETFDFEVLGYDEDLSPDVAVLATDYDAPGLPIGDSTSLSSGDPLMMVGHPGGFGNWVISLGRFERRSTDFGTDALLTSVPGLSGSSGSPMLNLDGEVVGVLNSSLDKSNDQLREDGTPKPADTDVKYQPLRQDVWMSAVPIEDIIERSEAWR